MKRNILIIDDDEWQADVFGRALQKEYEIQRASNGYEAIDMIDMHRPDVIVLDVLLAGTTAWTLLNELQSHDDLAHIPVILISNIAETVNVKNAEHYGVKAVLDKTTMHPQDVASTVKQVLA